jgi:CBS domain-containing protein
MDPNDVASARAAGRVVRDVMRSRPKTLPADATVADVRRLFADTHVVTALLVDGARFAGAVDRASIQAAPDDAPARTLARDDESVIISPDATVAEAMSRLDRDDSLRLVVVEPDATLDGLLCLNAARTSFCA